MRDNQQDPSEDEQFHSIWPPPPTITKQYDEALNHFLHDFLDSGEVATRYKLARHLQRVYSLNTSMSWSIVAEYCRRNRPDLLITKKSTYVLLLLIISAVTTSIISAVLGYPVISVVMSLLLFAIIVSTKTGRASL